MKKVTLLILTSIWVCNFINAQIFNPSMTVTGFGIVNSPAGEDVTKVIDGNINSKFLDFDEFDGMGFTVDLGGTPATAQSVEITTANDSPGRDGDVVEILGSNDGTNFTSIATIPVPCVTTRFHSRFFNFSNAVSYLHYRINFPTRCGTDGEMQVAEVQLYASQMCIAPTNLSASSITTATADLGWTDPSGSLWHIEWDTAGFTPGTGTMIVGATSSPQNITGLNSSTSYDFYVLSDCGPDSSNWVGPFTFSTPCAAITPVYIQPFNSFLPDNCWDEADNGSVVSGPTNLGSSSWESTTLIGNGAAKINLYTDTRSDWVLSPQFDLSAGGYEFRLDVAVTDYNDEFAPGTMGSDDTVKVVYTEDGLTWNTLLTWTVNDNLPMSLTNYSALIPSTGSNVQFGILATDGPINDPEDYDFFIDNFIIKVPQANDLGVIDIASTPAGCGLGMETVTIKVKNHGTATQNSFDVVYALNGTPVTPEPITSTINPGDTLTYVFTALANMSAQMTYTIDAWTVLATDTDNSNDTLSGWMTEHLNNSLAFMGQDSIDDNFTNGTSTTICTNGLVNGNLGSCAELSALVIDSLAHTYVGDLIIWLISPSGDSLLVSNGNGGTFEDMINVTFTDTASTNISGNTPTHGGFFHTEDTLGFTVFDGTNPEGAWTLLIFDDAGGDEGNIYNWHLEFIDNSFTVDLGADTTTCDSIAITLDAGITGSHSYVWSTGETTQQITVDTNSLGGNGAHNVTVTVTDSLTGCIITDSVIVTYTSCVGLNSLANNVNISIVPNPNTGRFNLNINSQEISQLDVRVVNIQGQIIFSKNNFDNINTVNEPIDLSNNAKGIYFVVITTDKGIKTDKLIIQ